MAVQERGLDLWAMLKIYCINLDRRADRWEQGQANFKAMGLDPVAVERLAAVEDAEFGALGCAKSHVMALARFLTRDSAPYGLFLEDDFEFQRPFGDLVDTFTQLTAQRLDWDALLLMGTSVVAHGVQAPGLARVQEAQSAAAYLVSRRYAATLLGCFADSVAQMEALRSPGLRAYTTSRLAIDQVWKPLQRRDRWYIFSPAFGHQRPSFSDIEQREVNYDATTYGLVQGTQQE
jgi:glycosyl transferase family 25